MKNYHINSKGIVTDKGDAKQRRPITSSPGLTPVTYGELVFIPPAQPMANAIVVQQADPPTPTQIASVVLSLSCPKSLPHWRVLRVLIKHGMLEAVLAYINAIEDADLKSTTLCAWEGGADVARRGPTVLGAIPALGLTDEQVDALFIEGAALEA